MAVADLAPDHGTDAGMPGAVLKPAAGQRPWPLLSGHFVDGGVVANNPTIAAMSFLQRIQNESQVTNTAVLSLGCGTCWDKSGLPIARGELFVASPLINIMMGANCDTAVAAGEMLFRTVRAVDPLSSILSCVQVFEKAKRYWCGGSVFCSLKSARRSCNMRLLPTSHLPIALL